MFSWFRWNSLSTNIIIWAFVPSAIILLVVALVTLNAYQQVTADLVIERDRELTQLAASKFIFDVSEYADLLLDETRQANIYSGESSHQQAALIQAQNRLIPFDGGVVILDSFGKVSATLPMRETLIGQDWSGRDYFIELLRSRKDYVFSNIVTDGPREALVVSMAVAVIGPQTEFRGAIVGSFLLDPASSNAFHGSLVSLRLGESGQMYLFDGHGHIIYHSDPTQIGKDFSAQDVVRRTLNGEGGALRTVDVGGQDIVAGYAPVPMTDWGLVTEESWAALTSDNRGYGMFLFGLLMLGVIVPTMLVAVGVRRIMRPIKALIQATQTVARGQFEKTLPVSSHNEIGELTDQFNLMSTELQASYAQLEQRVGDRTRELSTLYEVTSVANESLDLEHTLASSFQQVLVALGAELGSIQLLDEHGELHIAVQQGISRQDVEAIERLPSGTGLSYQVVDNNEPLLAHDLLNGKRTAASNETMPPYTYVGVPVRAKQKMLGALNVGRPLQQPFTPEDIALLGSIAEQIGVAIENAKLYEQAEHVAVIEERSRLARDLHDSVTQSLYSVILFAEAATRLADSGNMDDSREYMVDLKQNAQQALKELRLMVYELRSPTFDHEGLIGALKHRLSTVEERAGVKTEMVVDGACDFSESQEEALYRIAQEALNNALKHAAATSVKIALNLGSDDITLSVSDDGQGFDPASVSGSGGIGMLSMRERIEALGGVLQVISAPGSGTTIHCRLNLSEATA